MLTSVVDGHDACIFAYGQTGSGKTYSMEGTKDAPGVCTRALAKLFRLLGQRTAQHGGHYEVGASS